MLKRIVPIAFAIAAMIAPVHHHAGAWDEVCVKFPLWKTAFAGKFAVVYGFDESADGAVPGKHKKETGRNKTKTIADNIPGTNDSVADGAVYSYRFAANQTRCVDISAIPQGQRFFTVVIPSPGLLGGPTDGVVCETHSSNPDKFYYQQDRPYRKIWFESWGAVWTPQCEYTRESN